MHDSTMLNTGSLFFKNRHDFDEQVFGFLKSNTFSVCSVRIDKYCASIDIRCIRYGHDAHF